MARRIFISYQHQDQMKAKGFNLLRWNKNVDLDFVGRHLLDPVDSKNEKYIWEKVKEQIEGTSVTVVLIGKETNQSTWVADEIKHSCDKTNPSGVLAIKLENDSPLPANSPVGRALSDAAAEIINWDPSTFEGAIERAAAAAGRARLITQGSSGSGSSCNR